MERYNIKLPIQAATRLDIGRLIREINQVDNFLEQAAIREPGTTQSNIPKTSGLLDELTSNNGLNLLRKDDRMKLVGALTAIKTGAPLIHISFSTNPAPLFVQKILFWLRSEVHSYMLLQIGLQPEIGAGCIVRGNSLFLDLSLREYFTRQRPLLINRLNEDTPLENEFVESAGVGGGTDAVQSMDTQPSQAAQQQPAGIAAGQEEVPSEKPAA